MGYRRLRRLVADVNPYLHALVYRRRPAHLPDRPRNLTPAPDDFSHVRGGDVQAQVGEITRALFFYPDRFWFVHESPCDQFQELLHTLPPHAGALPYGGSFRAVTAAQASGGRPASVAVAFGAAISAAFAGEPSRRPPLTWSHIPARTRSMRTDSVGSAPFLIHSRVFSASTTMVAGSVIGL